MHEHNHGPSCLVAMLIEFRNCFVRRTRHVRQNFLIVFSRIALNWRRQTRRRQKILLLQITLPPSVSILFFSFSLFVRASQQELFNGRITISFDVSRINLKLMNLQGNVKKRRYFKVTQSQRNSSTLELSRILY